LRSAFGAGFAMHATNVTSTKVLDFLVDDLGAHVGTAPPDGRVGAHRRAAVAMTLDLDDPPADAILYSDLDHVLRWVEDDPDELERTIARIATCDVLVVGRSPEAMAASPRRLRETEAIVNQAFGLVAGHEGWDVMFAVRGFTRAAARAIVDSSTQDSIANDVDWPLLAITQGLRVEHAAAGGLSYRTTDDFGADADRRDDDAAGWIQRIEMAAVHAKAMRPYLPAG
jgi:hypothetical protein